VAERIDFSALVELPGMFRADALIHRSGTCRVRIEGKVLNSLFRGSILLLPLISAIVDSHALSGMKSAIPVFARIALFKKYSLRLFQLKNRMSTGEFLESFVKSPNCP
jgi:hypothetical protein